MASTTGGNSSTELAASIRDSCSTARDFSSQDGHMRAPDGHPDNKRPTLGSINALPNEILTHILEYLPPKRSIYADLIDEPRFDITHTKIANLKSASHVSKLWRQAASPILFKHARFIVPEPKDNRPVLEEQIKPFLDFAKRNNLHKILESFALVVQDAKISSCGKNPLDRFSSFWISIFDILDPAELLVVAPPEAMGTLSACYMMLGELWQFGGHQHNSRQYLQLKQPKTSLEIPVNTIDKSTKAQQLLESKIRSANETGDFGPAAGQAPRGLASLWPDDPAGDEAEAIAFPPRAERSTLLQGRPWSSLLLNEGSSIRAYATYEWWLRNPPSILSDLVGADFENQKPLISPTVRDLSYIGIFPMSTHFNCLVEHLPRLDRLYTQFVPRNETLQDPIKMANVEATDLWTERNSCYSYLMQQLFATPPDGNYKHLRVFESGDAADRDAWNMAVHYIERINKGWKVESEGVFVREPAADSEGDEGEGENSILSV